jgi:CBS domain-containing protein/anti-sigma regulatory factor (Ser/Thr protein kinase)
MSPKYAKTQELAYELKIGDVMATKLVTVTPETKMSELRSILREHRISGALVLDGDELVGIISILGLIQWLDEGAGDCPVSRIMNTEIVSLHADQTLAHAVERFETLGFGRFPVVNRETGTLAGILTKSDIIEGLLKRLEKEYAEEEVRQYRASHIFEDIVADHKEIFLSYEVIGKDFDRAGKASTRIKRNLKRLGIRPDIIRRIAIASYEAEMNVVIYADRGTMNFRVAPGHITLDIVDSGPGIEDLDKAQQEGYSTSTDWVREMGFGAGMGLSNIKRCSDRMTIDSTPGVGTSLTIRFLLGPEEDTEADRRAPGMRERAHGRRIHDKDGKP